MRRLTLIVACLLALQAVAAELLPDQVVGSVGKIAITAYQYERDARRQARMSKTNADDWRDRWTDRLLLAAEGRRLGLADEPAVRRTVAIMSEHMLVEVSNSPYRVWLREQGMDGKRHTQELLAASGLRIEPAAATRLIACLREHWQGEATIRAEWLTNAKDEILYRYVGAAGACAVTIANYAQVYNDLVAKQFPVDEKTLKASIEGLVAQAAMLREARALGLDHQQCYLQEQAMFEHSVIANLYEERFLAPHIVVTEEQIKAHYQAHAGEFSGPTTRAIYSYVGDNLKQADAITQRLRERPPSWVKFPLTPIRIGEKEIPATQQLMRAQALETAAWARRLWGAPTGWVSLAYPRDNQYVVYVAGPWGKSEPLPLEAVSDEIGQSLKDRALEQLRREHARELATRHPVTWDEPAISRLMSGVGSNAAVSRASITRGEKNGIAEGD